MGLFRKTVGNLATSARNDMLRLAGVYQYAASHPIQTTAVAGAIMGTLAYGSQSQQQIPYGRAEYSPRPQSIESSSNTYDGGATGNLVFALHRLG